MKKYFTFLLMLFFTGLAAQDVVYNNNTTDILSTNPAFAGSKDVIRISLNNQIRWYNALHQTTFNSLSADFAIDRFGFGYAVRYNTLSTGFTNASADMMVSYRVYKFRKFIITPAVKVSYNNWRLNTDELVFYDQLSVYDGILDVETNATIPNKQVTNVDMSLGFVSQFPIDLHWPQPLWANIGYAYDHIPQTTLAFSRNPDYKYPERKTFTAGLYIPLYKKDPETKQKIRSNTELYPNMKITSQGYSTIYNLGMNLFYKKNYMGGLAFQNFKNLSVYNRNQFIMSLGYNLALGDYYDLNIVYSVNAGVSVTSNMPVFITHEISFVLFTVNKRQTDCKSLKYDKKNWFNPQHVQQRKKGECPPGRTHRRKASDLTPTFYPIHIPKAYYWNEN